MSQIVYKRRKHNEEKAQKVVSQDTSYPYFPYTGKKLNLRCSPSNLISVLESLTKDQKKSVKDMQFSSILHLKLHCLPTSFGYWLLQNFDAETSVFTNGIFSFKVSPILINKVFGIPLGDNKVEETLKPNINDPVVREWRT